jgi:hypothetical protein
LALGVAAIIRTAMADAALFDLGASTNLSWTPTRVSDTEFILGVGNTQLTQQPLNITALFGSVTAVTEIALDVSEKRDVGYLPDGFAGADIGNSTATTVAGADFRMLRVTVAAAPLKRTLVVIPHTVFPPAPTKVWLRLPPSTASIRAALLYRPDFRQHFDGILLDWSYLAARTREAVQNDAVWMTSRRLSVGVDLSTGIDLFPKLRLGNFTETDDPPWNSFHTANGEFYNESIAVVNDVITKATVLGARDILLSLHGVPEIGPNATTTATLVAATLRTLVATAAAAVPSITLHLRHGKKNDALAGTSLAEQTAWLAVATPGIVIAPNTGVLVADGAELPTVLPRGSLLLLNGVTALYARNRRGTETASLDATDPSAMSRIAAMVRSARENNATVVLDAAYSEDDVGRRCEQRDTVWLESNLKAK